MVINVVAFVVAATLNMVTFDAPNRILIVGVLTALYCLIPHNFVTLKAMVAFVWNLISRRASKKSHP